VTSGVASPLPVDTGDASPPPPPPRPAAATPAHLLFLVADTGGGHRASAEAVARGLAAAHPGEFATHVLDPFVQASPRLVGRVVGLYSPITRYTPWLWGALYHATNSRAAVAALRGSALRLVEPGLREVIATLRPALVVSFHPLLNHVAWRALRSLPGPRIPLATVITDLVDVHAAWTCADVDAVVTSSPGGLDRARRAGVPAHRCFDLGLPVDESFASPALGDAARRGLRIRLGLSPDRFTVLLSGGGEGSGGLPRRAAAVLEAVADVDVVVICGRNLKAHTALESLRAASPGGHRLRVLGFVDNMSEWMRASNLLITKAGPGSIAEALCSRVPLLLTSYVPGQERGNVDFVVDTGAGRYVPRVREMVDAVRELSRPGAPSLASMREALGHAARPQATAQIAELVARLASPPSAA
jgi:1,2-diacylglycerol 3-beta-galactosyltransferase